MLLELELPLVERGDSAEELDVVEALVLVLEPDNVFESELPLLIPL